MSFDFFINAAAAEAIPLLRLGLSPVPAHLSLIDARGYVCSCGDDGCKGKHPLLTTWRQFQHVTFTEHQVHRFFAGKPWANVGHIHGWKQGTALSTFAIDLDGDLGIDSLHELERDLGPLPTDTPTILTGGGGLQHFYQHPGAECIVPTVKHVVAGIDIRGDGGFSMAPPSIHPSMRVYAWEADNGIEDVPLATLPENWMRWVLNARSGGVTRAGDAPAVPVVANHRGKIIDGREQFMTETVYKTFMRLYREQGGKPSVQSLILEAWNMYSPHVDLSKPGRGFNELENKCRSILQNRHLNLPLLEPPTFD